METIELLVTSLDEAQSKAADQWGVSVDEVKVTVLEETKGLFGRPGKLKVKAEKAKARLSKAKKTETTETTAPTLTIVEAEPVAAASEVPAPEKRKPAKKGKAAEAAPTEGQATQPEESTDSTEAPMATEEEANQVVEILNDLLEKGNLRATATVAGVNGRYINLQVDGKDVGYLVGKRGEVLNATQYLLNVITSRQLRNGVRVSLDGDHYRERREQTLTTMAINIATEVRNRGEEAVLDALPAFERRIIHQALVEFEGVNTYSEGEEPHRRVVIAPAE
ncbi:MAG: KH domain-containing protein [Fimbriimonadaceae bacterium]|jgi:spoIIIJ-associated protein|nr:KH domain-containing protein [Fimbriimonadaceae bacterium]